jgi:diacylglycerol kinase
MIDAPKTLRSFAHAGRGVVALFRAENNAKVHLLLAVAVVGAGLWLGLSATEWALILTQIGLVFAAEAINTALEKLADVVRPDYHPPIGAVKDLAAGAVLVLAVVAALVGGLILGPKLWALMTFPGLSTGRSVVTATIGSSPPGL